MRRLILVAVALVLAGDAARAQNTAPAASLEDLAFITGEWVGELGGGRTEETWSAPDGDNMMGMFRYVQDGRGVFYEFMLIERTEAGPVLRLRHFDPALVAWEEREGAWSYPLVEFAPGRAVFERPDGETRLIFVRESSDVLSVTLEQLKDGRMTPQEFRYTLIP